MPTPWAVASPNGQLASSIYWASGVSENSASLYFATGPSYDIAPLHGESLQMAANLKSTIYMFMTKT